MCSFIIVCVNVSNPGQDSEKIQIHACIYTVSIDLKMHAFTSVNL